MLRFYRKKIIEHPRSLMCSEGMRLDFVESGLKRRGYSLKENDLLRCIAENKSKTLVYYAVIELSLLGTAKSIPVLKTLVEYPKEDVQVCSVLAIGSIGKAAETPYFGELLDSRFRHKFWVMAAIWEVGDERALAAVKRLAGKIQRGKITVNNQSDILYVVEYLEKYESSPEVQTQMQAFRDKLIDLNPW